MWRPDRSVRGPRSADRPRHRPTQPGVRRGVHRPVQPRRAGGGAGSAAQPIWSGATRSTTPATAPWCGATPTATWWRSTWSTAPAPRGGWVHSRCGPTGRAKGSAPTMVRTGIDWLRTQGCTIIGLETMPRTVDNIGFYSRIGLVPAHLTVTLVHDVPRRPLGPGRHDLLSQCRSSARCDDRGVPAA